MILPWAPCDMAPMPLSFLLSHGRRPLLRPAIVPLPCLLPTFSHFLPRQELPLPVRTVVFLFRLFNVHVKLRRSGFSRAWRRHRRRAPALAALLGSGLVLASATLIDTAAVRGEGASAHVLILHRYTFVRLPLARGNAK